MIGNIHSIESFSTVDGPGIRYVVFLQGCNLRCKFCHNPDTWSKTEGTEMEDTVLLDKILKAKSYLTKGNGGVTFSGGEPLLQAKFLLNICQKLKKEGIHIAIDTSGNFETEDKDINALLPYIDLFLFDIKHIDDEEHQKLIGISNQKILKMATYLANEKKIPMWIRIVYIPGITDINNSLETYRTFITTLQQVEKIEVIPYHEMGKYKWKELGIPYELEDIKIPTEEQASSVSEMLQRK